ncbi:MAG: hypothetical protein GVY18_17530 [Bacteroidetes bacterium]|jgi:hypothetical protein|nr:hypothetical protein [Bacteroidota bacterium]
MRLSTLLSASVVVLLLSGCTSASLIATTAQPHYRHHDAPRAAQARAQYHRVARDVDDYVDFLDRRLRLTPRQERYLQRRLERATYRLLERTHPRDRRYVYPFPRRFEYERNRAVARWWDRADYRIERVLSQRQRIEYHRLTHRYDHRYRRDRRYKYERYERDRYDDRYRRYERDDRRYERGDWEDDDWDDDDWDEWDDDDRDDDEDDDDR